MKPIAAAGNGSKMSPTITPANKAKYHHACCAKPCGAGATAISAATTIGASAFQGTRAFTDRTGGATGAPTIYRRLRATAFTPNAYILTVSAEAANPSSANIANLSFGMPDGSTAAARIGGPSVTRRCATGRRAATDSLYRTGAKRGIVKLMDKQHVRQAY
jgi:hypothetical protein